MAGSHQRHKSDTSRLQDQLGTLEAGLHQSQARGAALEQELSRREEQVKSNEAEIKACRADIANKAEEVGQKSLKERERQRQRTMSEQFLP